jgi:hypothetical protein
MGQNVTDTDWNKIFKGDVNESSERHSNEIRDTDKDFRREEGECLNSEGTGSQDQRTELEVSPTATVIS